MPYKILFLVIQFLVFSPFLCRADSVKFPLSHGNTSKAHAGFSFKDPEFAGKFYPKDRKALLEMIDGFLDEADPPVISERVLGLISPHAGYGFSGPTAAFGYKLIEGKDYKTVIILGTSHHRLFSGAALYGGKYFITSLGRVDVDGEFIGRLVKKEGVIFEDPDAFDNEHSVEVQIPFLQRVLGRKMDLREKKKNLPDSSFKIVPVVVGDCSLEDCEAIASSLAAAIGEREDVLLVVSSDLYHGYDFREAEETDAVTLGLNKEMDYRKLYYALREGRAQACGGFAAVILLKTAKDLGCGKAVILSHTNSAEVTGDLVKGNWTVGYASCAITAGEGENMLSAAQKDELLKIARESIREYLANGKRKEFAVTDPALNRKAGAFVTLTLNHRLRGCIGSLTANEPLYLTVSHMAVEAAADDPRFPELTLPELGQVKIEISVLSDLKRVSSPDEIELGRHGVLVRKGGRSGVFLPQVAVETGWSKEEFLNHLCEDKAGMSKDAWRDGDTEVYIFSADVFSETGK